MFRTVTKILKTPFSDFISGLDSGLKTVSAVNFLLLFVCFAASWWIYVPIHELGHAFGCMLGGGSVSRLEISPLYGGGVLERIFPFVSSGSEYAGQLTGFDTHGSDLTYMLTVFLPFVLTIFVGVPLLRSASGSPPIAACVKLGIALPVAFAPFISLGGDYYEMGSIVVSRIAGFIDPALNGSLWRSDDLFKLSDELFFSGRPYTIGDIAGVACSFLLGVMFIYITYMLGVLWGSSLSGMLKSG